MPIQFSESKLFDERLPSKAIPLLNQLVLFQQMDGQLKAAATPPSPAELAKLRQCHSKLLKPEWSLLDETAMDQMDSRDLKRLFAFACMVTASWRQSALGDFVLDTAGSKTLTWFEADFAPGDRELPLMATLQRHLDLDDHDLDHIQAKLDHALGDLRVKRALIHALVSHYQIDEETPDRERKIHRFFRDMFPLVPLLSGEVQLIVTGSIVFFCLPYSRSSWDLPREGKLSPRDQEQLTLFLNQLNEFEQHHLANFPVFTGFDAEVIDPEVITTIAESADLDPHQVREELARLFVILPNSEIDKYVIHDAWGHSWQASILYFDDIYREISQYGQPLTLEEQAQSRIGGEQVCSSCFPIHDGICHLDAEAFSRFVLGELAERLPLTLTPAVAELTADMVEYKFLLLQPDRHEVLQSSSFFKDLPTKWDLTLTDLGMYFRQATALFSTFAQSAMVQNQLIADLTERGASKASARSAVTQAAALWRTWEQDRFADRLAWQMTSGDWIETNVFTRIVLNFLGLHRQILTLIQRLEGRQSLHLPMRHFHDLMVTSLCVFFESDRPKNLWHLDEYLAFAFLPLCERFGFIEKSHTTNS